MYKNWDQQKKTLLDVIAKGECATIQIVGGTNYSIFFRNMHSDLILKKSILPVFVDLNHLSYVNLRNIQNLVITGFRRALNEKRYPSRVESNITPQSDLAHKIEQYLEEASLRNLTPVVFMEDLDVILSLGTEAFAYFESLRRLYKKCSFLYLSKTNLSHPDNVKKYRLAPHLYENVIYMPIKDERYLKSLEKGTSPKTFKRIYSLTGGIDSFFSVAMDLKNNLVPRERKNIEKHIISNWHLRSEVHKLWDSLSQSEIKVLCHIVWGVNEFEKELEYDFKHLLNLGIVEKHRNGFRIVIGLLRLVGVEKINKYGLTVEFNKDKFLVNGTSISLNLSDPERKVLKQFVTNKNKIVARGDIVKSINSRAKSKNGESIVEQTVSRLKNKLSDVWINPNNLVSVEGRGFIYREA
ncbi:MAG: helix-turn-helix domain-containing protein [Patescibacteria group bacterium]